MKEKLLKIINHYGLENQREYLGREYQELQDELYRYVVIGDEADLLTEIADVFVLCLQFLYEYGYSNEELINEMNFKIDRQLKRMEEEKPKKIEEIPYHYNLGYIDCGDLKREVVEELSKNFNYFADKINELTKAVNYLLEKESDK